MNSQRHNLPESRPGFTLLELMIVIGIIALLVGISFAVIGGLLDSAKRAATLATIAKLDKLYQGQLGAYYRLYDINSSELKQASGNFLSTSQNYPIATSREAALVVAQKALQVGAFPQHALEVYGYDHNPSGGTESAAFAAWAAGGNTPSRADSIELLFLALTEGGVRGAPPTDSSAFSASELGDTDGDGFTEVLDAWGEPLRFYRWSTRLINPIGYTASRLTSMMPTAGAGDTGTINLPSGHGNNFPDPAQVEYYVVVGTEQMLVTAQSANDLTVVRGQRSTDPAAHGVDAVVKLAPFTELATMLLGFINSDTLAKDPDDRFSASRELDESGNLKNLQQMAREEFTGTGAAGSYELFLHTLDSYNPALIVSCGPDGELGLVEPGPTTTSGSGTNEPGNIWIAGSSGPPTSMPWRWGTLAQPFTDGGTDFSIISNPGSSTLADNLTNHMEGMGN